MCHGKKELRLRMGWHCWRMGQPRFTCRNSIRCTVCKQTSGKVAIRPIVFCSGSQIMIRLKNIGCCSQRGCPHGSNGDTCKPMVKWACKSPLPVESMAVIVARPARILIKFSLWWQIKHKFYSQKIADRQSPEQSVWDEFVAIISVAVSFEGNWRKNGRKHCSCNKQQDCRTMAAWLTQTFLVLSKSTLN